MKHYQCKDCGQVVVWRFFHAKEKHPDWKFRPFKIEWERFNKHFERVERIFGSWHPVRK